MERSHIAEQLGAMRQYAEERRSALDTAKANLNAERRALMLGTNLGGSLASAQAIFTAATREHQAICDEIERLEGELRKLSDSE